MVSISSKTGRIIKRIVATVLFLAILLGLLLGAEEILRYKWEYDVTPDYESWESQAPGTIDLVFFSSSNLDCGVAPIVLYKKAGITSFHWGQSWGSAPVEYFLFQYCLKADQDLKAVVIDARDMFTDRSVDNYKDPPYRRFMATHPDKEIRTAMLGDILENNPKQKWIEWVFPLFYYHTRWNQLEKVDFIPEPYDYKEYRKGCSLRYQEDNVGGKHDYAASRSEPSVPNAYSKSYYDKIAAECTERGIQLIVVTLPERTAFLSKEDCAALGEWCDSVGAIYWDFLDPKYETEIPLPASAYANVGHMNPLGATLFSSYLAQMLADTGILPDHRGEAGYESWDECYAEFYADYPELHPYLD